MIKKFNQFINEDNYYYDESIMKVAAQIWDNADGDDKIKWIKMLGYEFSNEEKIKVKEWESFKEKIQEELAQLFFEELGFSTYQ